jgi:formylglycine-generating enzyme required for sulfatase activity
MITCPAGGKVNIYRWGLQEIKEPFMLAETEVTQELFEAVMYFNYSDFKDSNKNPVENVTWFDCLEFCNRLSDYFDLDHCYLLRDKKFTNRYYPLSIGDANAAFIIGANGFRLPKEWEWQIAAMAGTNNQYAGANDDESLKRVAWLYKNSGEKTHAVAQKKPNEWGFYDMSGNVWEWCENSITPDKNIDPSAGRVDRGGGWFNEASDLRSAKRDYFSASDRYDGIGFRVARSI